MYMKKRQIVIVLVVVVACLLAALFWWFNGQRSGNTVPRDEKRGVQGDVIDVALDFYESWLFAKQSSTTNPYTEHLDAAPALSVAMSKKLADAASNPPADGHDPVLCQIVVPSGLRSKLVFEKGDAAQVIILSKEKGSDIQSLATLARHDGLWEITDITCTQGEQAPDQGEFSFDTEGKLLRTSLPPPFNPQYWYLVFEEAGVPGYTAPLLLSDTSTCVSEAGVESVCTDALFSETLRVHVQGTMTEAGVQVKRVEILK